MAGLINLHKFIEIRDPNGGAAIKLPINLIWNSITSQWVPTILGLSAKGALYTLGAPGLVFAANRKAVTNAEFGSIDTLRGYATDLIARQKNAFQWMITSAHDIVDVNGTLTTIWTVPANTYPVVTSLVFYDANCGGADSDISGATISVGTNVASYDNLMIGGSINLKKKTQVARELPAVGAFRLSPGDVVILNASVGTGNPNDEVSVQLFGYFL